MKRKFILYCLAVLVLLTGCEVDDMLFGEKLITVRIKNYTGTEMRSTFFDYGYHGTINNNSSSFFTTQYIYDDSCITFENLYDGKISLSASSLYFEEGKKYTIEVNYRNGKYSYYKLEEY